MAWRELHSKALIMILNLSGNAFVGKFFRIWTSCQCFPVRSIRNSMLILPQSKGEQILEHVPVVLSTFNFFETFISSAPQEYKVFCKHFRLLLRNEDKVKIDCFLAQIDFSTSFSLLLLFRGLYSRNYKTRVSRFLFLYFMLFLHKFTVARNVFPGIFIHND